MAVWEERGRDIQIIIKQIYLLDSLAPRVFIFAMI